MQSQPKGRTSQRRRQVARAGVNSQADQRHAECPHRHLSRRASAFPQRAAALTDSLTLHGIEPNNGGKEAECSADNGLYLRIYE